MGSGRGRAARRWLLLRLLPLSAVPLAPLLQVQALNFTATVVRWKASEGNVATLWGYRPPYHEEGQPDGTTVQLGARRSHYVIGGLDLRTKYHVGLLAYTSVGDGYREEQTLPALRDVSVQRKGYSGCPYRPAVAVLMHEDMALAPPLGQPPSLLVVFGPPRDTEGSRGSEGSRETGDSGHCSHDEADAVDERGDETGAWDGEERSRPEETGDPAAAPGLFSARATSLRAETAPAALKPNPPPPSCLNRQ